MSALDAPPFQAHSRTSQAAAERIAPFTGTKRGAVLEFVKARGDAGATDEEMQFDIPMGANTQRPRRVELVQLFLIRDSGKTRQTLSGDQAVVWVAA